MTQTNTASQQDTTGLADVIAKSRSTVVETLDNTTLLLYGQPGSGKTRFVGTSPPPVLLLEFDPHGERSVADKIRDGLVDVIPFYASTSNQIKGLLWVLDQLKSDEKYRTVAIDSLTYFMLSLQNYILTLAGRAKVQYEDTRSSSRPASGVLQIQDYQVLAVEAHNILKEFCSLKKNFILTAHADMVQDDTGAVFFGPSAPGRVLPKTLIGLFDEVWWANTQLSGGETVYYIQTFYDGKHIARSRSIGLPPRLENVSFEDVINKFIQHKED